MSTTTAGDLSSERGTRPAASVNGSDLPEAVGRVSWNHASRATSPSPVTAANSAGTCMTVAWRGSDIAFAGPRLFGA